MNVYVCFFFFFSFGSICWKWRDLVDNSYSFSITTYSLSLSQTDIPLSFPDHCETISRAFSDIQEILGEGKDINKMKDFSSV